MWNFKYSIFDIQHLIFDIQYLISNIISNIRNGKGGKSGWFDHCEWNVLQICKCGKCGRSGKCVTNWHWQNCNWNFNCNCNCNWNQLLRCNVPRNWDYFYLIKILKCIVIIDWNTYIVVIQLCIWNANAVIHHFVFKSLNVIVILILIVIIIRHQSFSKINLSCESKFVFKICCGF